MITKKEVQHIAKLARIGITPAEEEKFVKELFGVLAYVEKLKEVDISRVGPTSHPLKVENVMREDEGRAADYKLSIASKILELAPETKDGYIKVKSISR